MDSNPTFLVSTSAGLTRAAPDDAGGWTVESLLPGRRAGTLAADPHRPGIIYAGTDREGVLVSHDRGRTWASAGLVGQTVKALAVSSLHPGTIYAGTRPPCLFVSRDGGENWEELQAFRRIRGRRFWRSPAEPPDFRAYISAIGLSPSDPDVIVAGIEFGAVVRSADGGRSWSNHLAGSIRDCHDLTFHGSDGDWVYEAGASLVGASVSRDGGRTWRQPREGLHHRYGWRCAADPARPALWYLSAGPIGWGGVPQAHKHGEANAAIYRRDGEGAWERLGGGLPEPMTHMAYALVTRPDHPGHLYAGLSSGDLWQTTDYGDHWQQVPVNLGHYLWRMLLLEPA